jgi:hypothetical protein
MGTVSDTSSNARQVLTRTGDIRPSCEPPKLGKTLMGNGRELAPKITDTAAAECGRVSFGGPRIARASAPVCPA